jgi:NADPH2:quinone reductase
MPRAVVCRELGPPEKLTLEDVARAPLAPGQVRVAIHAAGLNFPDILMAAGAYQLKPPLPFTPGMEAAGEVIEVAGADGFHPGDKVIVKARFGCYADEIIAAPDQLMPLPLTFDYAQGAAFLAAHGTAWHALHDRARIARRGIAGARRGRRSGARRRRTRQGGGCHRHCLRLIRGKA